MVNEFLSVVHLNECRCVAPSLSLSLVLISVLMNFPALLLIFIFLHT